MTDDEKRRAAQAVLNIPFFNDGVLARERPKMCHLRELETLK